MTDQTTTTALVKVRISELYAGDRFIHEGQLYTHIHNGRCRQHSPFTLGLDAAGFGFRIDELHTLPTSTEVVFIPPP